MNKTITDSSEWDPVESNSVREYFDKRIRGSISSRTWKLLVTMMLKDKTDFKKIKVAEVGSGTGTFSLIFALLGAEVTLFDYNRKALENAKKIYALYGIDVTTVEADCVNYESSFFDESYDLVSSSGLGEHFIKEDRLRCFDFHCRLLKPGGYLYYGVPNNISLCYWVVRAFRQLTKTWRISLEAPFTPSELMKFSRNFALNDAVVVGVALLRTDIKDYSRGLISALVESLPDKTAESLRRMKNKKIIKGSESPKSLDMPDMRAYCQSQIDKNNLGFTKSIFADVFSAGIVLIARK